MILRARQFEFHFPRPALLMGVVNVTPDSFSDGGKFLETSSAVAHALELIDQGADIIDVGGESTRPYSTPVSEAEELSRVLPVIEWLAKKTNVPLSIDTSKAAVARAAVAAGAEIINDVTGLAGDPEMLQVAVESGAGVCAMHMRGTPQTMQDDPRYDDIVGEILGYLGARRDQLIHLGVAAERICLDPGVGFGKSHEHNVTLCANAWRLHALGCPVLVGHSRKGFIGKLIGDKDVDRTPGTIGVACALAAQGIQILRIHDIAEVRQALMLFEATSK